jgi:capsid portal protein
MLDYLCGDEMVFDHNPLFEQSLEELFEISRKLLLDYIVYNACSFQRLYNAGGILVRVAYLDQTKVRYNEDLTKIYYHNDWKRSSDAVAIPLNLPQGERGGKTDAVTLRSICKGIYPTPLYNGALKSIVIANKIDTYHLNNISNNFAAAAIINFNGGVPDEKTKDAIESAIREKFSGEENAGKFIVSWNEGKENEATVTVLSSNDFDAKYNALRTNYEQNIVVAFRCPAQLLGYGTEKTTFNTIEYVAAFDLYNRTVIKPMQAQFVRFFNKSLEGMATLNIKPYTIRFDASDYDSNKNLDI